MSTARHIFATAAAAGLFMAGGAAPAVAQDALVIQGGTVHSLAGEPRVADVVIEDGIITAVAPGADAPAGADVIDATGQHVYPGLFDAVTQIGLTEIGAVDVTSDIDELGDFTPHLQAMTAVHPSTEHIPVARANGITHTVATPDGGTFPGQGSLINLDGWSVEEMLVDPGAFLVLEWPEVETSEFDFETFTSSERSYEEAKEEYDADVRRIADWLDAARSYAESRAGDADVRPNLRLEALGRVTGGDMPLLVMVESERQIRDAVAFAEEEGLDVILGGAPEGWKAAELLAERDVPVIVGATQAMPTSPDEAYDEPYANAGKLHAAGVKIAFATYNSADSRTLPYEAAMATGYGLPREEALRAITINAAEMLGVDDRLGTIEAGKIANLVVTDGDPLEITTRFEHVIIDGRDVDTMNRHRELYELWRSRPTPGASSSND